MKFSWILYWLYIGDGDEILELDKLNENLYEYSIFNLEINTLDFLS